MFEQLTQRLGSALEALRGLGVPVVDDLGSGTLLDTAAYGLGHEPTVQESLRAGAAPSHPCSTAAWPARRP